MSTKSKVQIGRSACEELDTVNGMKLEHVREEGKMRLDRARESEATAQKDLDTRRKKADDRVEVARKHKECVYEHCDEIERSQKEFAAKIVAEVARRATFWDEQVEEVEAHTARRVEEVRCLTEQLKMELANQANVAEGQAQDKAEVARVRAKDHERVLDQHLSHQVQHAADVARHSEERVAKATALATQQLSEAEALQGRALEQASAEHARVTETIKERLLQEEGRLQSYFREDADGKAITT